MYMMKMSNRFIVNKWEFISMRVCFTLYSGSTIFCGLLTMTFLAFNKEWYDKPPWDQEWTCNWLLIIFFFYNYWMFHEVNPLFCGSYLFFMYTMADRINPMEFDMSSSSLKSVLWFLPIAQIVLMSLLSIYIAKLIYTK